jgi:UDP-N-acetyl-D-galactosamine dehydrogenase
LNFNDKIKDNNIKISVVGLGYVGLPLAVEFAKCTDVIGFDINEKKVEAYKSGIDVTQEVGDFEVKNTDVNFTSDESKLKEAKFHIVAVPTPINTDKTPNLQPVISATETVGRNLTKGSIVVYESTVYPGTTEEVCIPILEETSGLKYMEDFKVGYSPERINPGDKINRLTSIVKVVSGCDAETLEIIADTYQMIIEAGVYKAESIKVAEAAKVIENSQRDINIAFMNELAMVFDKMDIDTHAVLRAASTKWNFLNFTPGLVGGHCIGVDPYYFIYKAEELGYHSQVISAGRKINDGMAKFVSDNVVKSLIKADKKVKGSKVAVFGLTFKENCPDTRNTKVVDIIKELREYEVDILVHDPIADAEEASDFYGIDLSSIEDIQDVDAVVFAVAHDEFDKFDLKKIGSMFKQGTKVLIDIKGLFDKEEVLGEEFVYWRL